MTAKKTATKPAEKPEAASKASAKTTKITRENALAWWCPLCDHSNTGLVDTCGNCGAVRDGDKVKAA